MQLTGAEILIEALKAENTDTIFGYPGASILKVYDCLYGEEKIKNYLTVGEQGAIFAAEGYARSTGKVGVVLATSGPGATNLITGIADASMDSIPLVVITGNVPLSRLGHDSFQEVDTSGIAMPVTKYSYIVKNVSDLSFIVAEAFKLADSGRKGPVLIDIPENIFGETAEYVKQSNIPVKLLKEDLSKLDEIANLINDSKKPVLYCGGGIIQSNASAELISFSEKINAPVALTLMGTGCFSSSHKNYIGLSIASNPMPEKAFSESDLLITLGARYASKAIDHNINYTTKLKMIHIDSDIVEIDKNLSSDLYLACDLKKALSLILTKIKQKQDFGFIDEIKSGISAKLPYPLQVLRALNEKLGNNQIVATDVGQHMLWTAAGYNFDTPRTFLASGGLGAMGFGLGAAIGASIATKKKVLLVTSDGSFNMDCNELLTAVKYKIPLIILVFNNGALGMIRQLQKKKYKKRYIASTLDVKTDYVALAKAYGAAGFRLNKTDDIDSILEKALNYELPVVIDCKIDIDETGTPIYN